MYKIIFGPFGLLSHYLRCIEIAKSLKDKNFRILFINSPEYSEFVKLNGFDVVYGDFSAFSSVISKARNFDFSWLRRDSLELLVRKLVLLFERERPDLFVS